MRCISKRSCVVLLSMLMSVIFCACKGNEYSMQYDPDTNNSAFTFGTSYKEANCDGFASYLCVAKEDIPLKSGTLNTVGAGGLFDVNNKVTLYSKNVNTKMNPASLTKVMTALIALEYGNLEDTITASSNVMITESGAQLMGLKEGDKLTLEQALHGLLMYSGNDCGVAIAEYLSGSVEAFAELMNQKALSLGATNTHFTNPHGLTDEQHYTTAYDLYLIFNEAMRNEKFREIISKQEFAFTYKDRDGNPKEFECKTTNGYLSGDFNAPSNVTVIGGKTGTTDAAGSCLILLSTDSASNPYISIVLNDEDRDMLYNDMSMMLVDVPD